MTVAKLFTNGSSQAVRLPKQFRFEGMTQVSIEKKGDVVMLRPMQRPSIDQAIKALAKFERFPARNQPRRQDKRETF
jgi:antitoxin VapB